MSIYGMVGKPDAVNLFCFRVARMSMESTALVRLDEISRDKAVAVAFSARGYGCTSDNIVHVVLAGEIANRRELNLLIDPKASSNRSDAGLFAALFQKHGAACLGMTNGQLCAVVWDSQNGSLSLFLDRVGGIKTLYYANLEGGLVFGSNLNSVLAAPSIRREINLAAVRQLFATGFILPPTTILKGVSKICPGEHVLCARDAEIKRCIVDRVDFDSGSHVKQSANDLCEKLIDSLRSRTEDTETGFLLSGGIDSSSLLALTAQGLGRTAQTFTAAFPGSELDESPYAECVAQANECPNVRVELSDKAALDDLPEIIWHLGEPFLDFSVIPTFQLFRQIRSKTHCIVSGDGPDHLFGRYYPLAAKRYIAASYPRTVKLLSALKGCSFIGKVRKAGEVSLTEAYRGLFAIPAWGVDHAGTMLGLLNLRDDQVGYDDSYLASLIKAEQKTYSSYFDAISTLDFHIDGAFGVFAKVGRMAEAHGLTVREPYLDRHVVDFIALLPLAQKQFGTMFHYLASQSRAKYLLKYGLGPRVLPEMVIKKKKGGFTPPLAQWLKETVCWVPVDQLLCKTLREAGVFDKDVVDKLLKAHLCGARDWSRIIFLIIAFDLWVRLYIEANDGTCPEWKLDQIYA
jgi:asparagine synthase (glutamine-hydrolysing)